MSQSELPRVLVAGTPEAVALVEAVLGREATLVGAHSVEAAVQRLDERIALILAHVRFDDSRIFDFLAALREGDYRQVPVLCFRVENASLPPAMEKSVALALDEVGVAAFVDLPALASEKGMEAALAELRASALSALRHAACSPQETDAEPNPRRLPDGTDANRQDDEQGP